MNKFLTVALIGSFLFCAAFALPTGEEKAPAAEQQEQTNGMPGFDAVGDKIKSASDQIKSTGDNLRKTAQSGGSGALSFLTGTAKELIGIGSNAISRVTQSGRSILSHMPFMGQQQAPAVDAEQPSTPSNQEQPVSTEAAPKAEAVAQEQQEQPAAEAAPVAEAATEATNAVSDKAQAAASTVTDAAKGAAAAATGAANKVAEAANGAVNAATNAAAGAAEETQQQQQPQQ